MLPGCGCCHPLHSLEFFHWISRHPGFAKDFAHIIQSPEYDQFIRELAGHLPPPSQTADQIVLDLFDGKREPHRVHQLFFSDDAVKAWRKHFASLSPAPYRVTYDAVFVHQKPYVRFSGGRCELGDVLLLLVDSFDKRLYASFLQAKMFDEWPPNTDHAQWKLYTKWPTFEYTPAQGLREICKLRFPGPVGCAKYMILDESEKRLWLNNAVIESQALTMSEQIHRYFASDDIRPVAWSKQACASDWDRLIWNLIVHTATCQLPAGQVGGATGMRGTWIRDNLVSRDVTNYYYFAPASDFDFRPFAIPIIVIESGFSPDGDQRDRNE